MSIKFTQVRGFLQPQPFSPLDQPPSEIVIWSKGGHRWIARPQVYERSDDSAQQLHWWRSSTSLRSNSEISGANQVKKLNVSIN